MNKAKLFSIAALSFVVASATISQSAVAPRAASSAEPPATEVARIRAHLARVETELRARDVSHLAAAQRSARATHLDRLRAYRERGVFPHNHQVPGERVPVFVDEHGTHCAVGHLIAMSGGAELVVHIAGSRNLATVPELADIPELGAWLQAAGLTVEEAAMIQPAYGGCDMLGCIEIDEEHEVTGRYAVASALFGAAAGAGLTLNLLPSRMTSDALWPKLLGVAAGGAAIALGSTKLDNGGDALALGAVNVGIGAASALFGIRRMVRGDNSPAPTAASSRVGFDVRLAPALRPETGSLGTSLQVRIAH